MDRLPVGIIGATGAVGQRFVQLLDDHPWFEIPKHVADKTVEPIDAGVFRAHGIKLVFSALPADSATGFEPILASSGLAVFSNASAFRMKENVPLLIADVNPEHLALINVQQQSDHGTSGGYIVTNPNCAVVGLATVLKPLLTIFGLKDVVVSTYQAISGAGYPGVPSMDIQGNVIPYITNEEDKVEMESQKILGSLDPTAGGAITPVEFDVMANCARVPVRDGHLEAVVLELIKECSMDDVKHALSNYTGLAGLEHQLPTAPERPILIAEDDHRPQPILDLDSGTPERAKGMAVTVGRLKLQGSRLRLFLLVHNTIRGAAGCSIMNAELAKLKGFL